MKKKTEKSKRRVCRIVITGGPGAGKTALLQLAQKTLLEEVCVLPEAASLLYGGGFWRSTTYLGKCSAQRAIFHVQRELEAMAMAEGKVILCDRGSLDGLAYWPGTEASFFKELHTTRKKELARYQAVIHLRTPGVEHGYNYQNPLRIETPEGAALLDKKTFRCWRNHPKHYIVNGSASFFDKAEVALEILRGEIAEFKSGKKNKL